MMFCITTVKFGWLNQNPFNSMFWAVQGMAAEFSTGFLLPKKLENLVKISMLVVKNEAEFTKKRSEELLFLQSRKELDAVLQRAMNLELDKH